MSSALHRIIELYNDMIGKEGDTIANVGGRDDHVVSAILAGFISLNESLDDILTELQELAATAKQK